MVTIRSRPNTIKIRAVLRDTANLIMTIVSLRRRSPGAPIR
jgi:hypothetical protein